MLPVIYNHTLRSLCTPLEQAPAALPPIPLLLVPPRHHALLARLQLSQPLHLLEHVLKQVLAPHNIEVALDLRVLACESVDFILGKAPPETRVKLAWELALLMIRLAGW